MDIDDLLAHSTTEERNAYAGLVEAASSDRGDFA